MASALRDFPRECIHQLSRDYSRDRARLIDGRVLPAACIRERLRQATEPLPGNAPRRLGA